MLSKIKISLNPAYTLFILLKFLNPLNLLRIFPFKVKSYSRSIIGLSFTVNKSRRFTAVSRFPECDPIYDNDPYPDVGCDVG